MTDDTKRLLKRTAGNSASVLGYVSTAATFFPIGSIARPYVLWVGLILIIVGVFRGAQALVAEKNKEIATVRSAKDKEIESLKNERDLLKQRPYDEEHRQLAEGKVNKLSEVSKDLVCYLLHYGETEADDLQKRCKHSPEYNDAVQRARDAGLVIDTQVGNPGRSSVRYLWKVNPKFETVLEDLLGQRKTIYF